MMQRLWFVAAAAMFAIISACGAPAKDGGNGGGDGGPDLECVPGEVFCGGDDENTVMRCNEDGTGGTFVGECLADQACFGGECLAGCEAAERKPSNVGCHFWAVDLDNEGDAVSDAAAQQFAVVAANVNDYEARVDVFQNAAPFGQPPIEELVASATIAGNGLAQIDLPQREVDGTMGQGAPYARGNSMNTGTFVSSHAFRIESSAPIVAYQFQPIIQQFSNDASILIPRQALGKHYTVFGWPSAIPCAPPPGGSFYMEGKPDYTFLTIVGAEEETRVTVMPTHPIKASVGPSGIVIPMTPAGTPLELVIGPYDVVNLESELLLMSFFDCPSGNPQDGDFTGTVVTSDKRVSVFSGVEATNSFGGATPPMPPYENQTCCTDHLEEQMLPTHALGWTFAVSRSPVRSPTSWEEPDLYRVLATVDGTVIETNLPAPFDQFTLDGGQFKAFHAFTGFTLHATGGAVMVGQVLVSQGQAGPWPMEGEPQGIGDPSLTIFPAIDQFRSRYTFLVPTTWERNYMVLSMPVGATFELDGSDEFPPACEERPIGPIAGVEYEQVTCALSEGVHHVSTTEPSGLTVYGYYAVGSYSYPGGSDVNIINPID
jgi:hypothetical protein